MAMPTKFNLSFRKYTIAELRANLESLQLLEDPHGFVRKVDDNFVHLLESNPSASANDLALILCTDGDTIVGRLGLIAGKVCFNGEFQSLYWMAGFFLDEKYRTSGAGGLLLLHALSFSRHLLAAGGPAPNAIHPLWGTTKLGGLFGEWNLRYSSGSVVNMSGYPLLRPDSVPCFALLSAVSFV